jgi:RNA polymerase sigma-70 factor (ECF subfamily)
LVHGIRAGNAAAMAEFHTRFSAQVERILWGIMGPDHELADLHHDVFVRALQSIEGLKDPEALHGWMNSIAVHTARSAIEKRISRRRWTALLGPRAAPEPARPDPTGQLDAREALRAVHALLAELPVDDRVAFALRHLDGLELADAAEACETSLATLKRRLARAEAKFAKLAERSPHFVELIEQGAPRWNRR